MRSTRVFVLLAAVLTSAASAQTPLAGKWKAVFVGPIGDQPKMLSEVILDLQVDGRGLTGTALMGDWPGLAPISEGLIKGNRFSFTAIGSLWSSSGYPKMGFDGTLEGAVMKLTMTWGYVDGNPADARKLPMEAKRVK